MLAEAHALTIDSQPPGPAAAPTAVVTVPPVPATPAASSKRRRWPLAWVGMGASLLLHFKALAACQLWVLAAPWFWLLWSLMVLWLWPESPRAELLSVESGKASVLLIATMEASADNPDQQPEVTEFQLRGVPQAVEPLDATVWLPERAQSEPRPKDHPSEVPQLPLDPWAALLADARRPSSEAASHQQPLPAIVRGSRDPAELKSPQAELSPLTGESASQASQASAASAEASGSDAEAVPRVVYNPAPPYPREALRLQLSGRVVLRVRVGREGQVLAASVYRSSGVPSLDQAALGTIWNWRFEPARRDAVATETEVAVPINFTLAK